MGTGTPDVTLVGVGPEHSLSRAGMAAAKHGTRFAEGAGVYSVLVHSATLTTGFIKAKLVHVPSVVLVLDGTWTPAV